MLPKIPPFPFPEDCPFCGLEFPAAVLLQLSKSTLEEKAIKFLEDTDMIGHLFGSSLILQTKTSPSILTINTKLISLCCHLVSSYFNSAPFYLLDPDKYSSQSLFKLSGFTWYSSSIFTKLFLEISNQTSKKVF